MRKLALHRGNRHIASCVHFDHGPLTTNLCCKIGKKMTTEVAWHNVVVYLTCKIVIFLIFVQSNTHEDIDIGVLDVARDSIGNEPKRLYCSQRSSNETLCA